jgi:methionyl-tRNA synthetase
MVHKYGRLEALRREYALPDLGAASMRAAVEKAWDEFMPSVALQGVWVLLRKMNGLIDARKPWQLAQQQDPELDAVLATCCEALRWAALMLAPAMPSAGHEILRQLGREQDEGSWPSDFRWPGGALAEPKPMFPRLDPERQAELIARWTPPEGSAPAAVPGPADIAFEDFAKLDLRAAKVLAAERIPKADKLLKLTLDLGSGQQRTVVSGIAPAYTPEGMVGRTVVYVANLLPKKIRGIESRGMILAAGGGDVQGLVALDRDVPPGTPIG